MNPAIATEPIAVETTQASTPAYDPNDYEIRWGLNAVLREKQLNPRECGYAFVPYARFFPIVSFSTPREVHSIDWTMEKELPYTVPAVEAERFFLEALAGEGIQETVNWGFQSSFVGNKDVSLYAVLSAILFPKLSQIRAVCVQLSVPCPIAKDCEATEDLDFEPRESCPTCWSKWIGSQACGAYAEYVEAHGMQTVEFDKQTGEQITRTIKPTIAQFESARAMAKKALVTGIRTLQTQWGTIASEMESEQSKRKDMLDFEHSYRKDLHQPRPQDRQVAALDRAMNRVADVVNPGSVSGGNDDLIRALVNSQIGTNQVINAIREKLEVLMPESASIPTPEPGPTIAQDVIVDDSLAPGAAEMLQEQD